MEKEKRQRLLWILFGLFLLIQHRFVFMHYDDWGYAGLSYGYLGNAHGRYWNALDLLGFLKWHYLNWGGESPVVCRGSVSASLRGMVHSDPAGHCPFLYFPGHVSAGSKKKE